MHQPQQWNIGTVQRYVACRSTPQAMTLVT